MNVKFFILLSIFLSTLVIVIYKLETNKINLYKTTEPQIYKSDDNIMFVGHTSENSTNNNTKTILFWDSFHGDKTMNLALGSDIFKNCKFSNCMTTNNKSYLPEDAFDAIVFHGARWNHKQNGVPKIRHIKQKYIFFSWESPYNTDFNQDFNKNFYNYTMTYRRDSDIYYPYGGFKMSEKNKSLPTVEQVII